MRIENLRFVLILLATLLSLSFARGLDSAPTPGPIVLKYGRIFPEEHWVAKRVEIPWFNLIEKRTKGRLKIKCYTGTIREQLDAIKAGVGDMGVIVPMYFPKELPITQVTGLPLIVDLHKYLNVINAIYETNDIKKEWEVNNCKPLLQIATRGYHFWSKKPITKVADLPGIKIASILGAEIVEALGASPVVGIPIHEMYNALQKGTVDAVYSSISGFKSSRFYEVAKYGALFGAKGGFTPGRIAINLNSWKKLAPDIQKIILDTAQEVESDLARFLIRPEDDIKFLKEQGVKIYSLPPYEVKRLIDTVTKRRVHNWIEKYGDQGHKLLQEVETKSKWPCFLNPPACEEK